MAALRPLIARCREALVVGISDDFEGQGGGCQSVERSIGGTIIHNNDLPDFESCLRNIFDGVQTVLQQGTRVPVDDNNIQRWRPDLSQLLITVSGSANNFERWQWENQPGMLQFVFAFEEASEVPR